jgi:hypothetical protein
MASRKASPVRRRTTGDALRRLLSPGGSGLGTRTTLVRQLSGRLLMGSPSRSLVLGRSRRRSTKRRRSRNRSPGRSLFRSRASSPISVGLQMPYSSGLDALLPPGFRKFFFLGATPTRSTMLGSSWSDLYSVTRSSQGNWNSPLWTPEPGPTFSGPRIPSTPTPEQSV